MLAPHLPISTSNDTQPGRENNAFPNRWHGTSNFPSSFEKSNLILIQRLRALPSRKSFDCQFHFNPWKSVTFSGLPDRRFSFVLVEERHLFHQRCEINAKVFNLRAKTVVHTGQIE
jgi:hypothetical protein